MEKQHCNNTNLKRSEYARLSPVDRAIQTIVCYPLRQVCAATAVAYVVASEGGGYGIPIGLFNH